MKILDVWVLLAAMGVFISGCEQFNNPYTNPNELRIKKETVWNSDLNSEEKTTIHSYKEFDINGNIIAWQEYFDNGSIFSDYSYTYQQHSSIELKKVYKPTGEIDTISKSSIIFDEKGKILSKVIQSNDGDTISILEFSYDNSGNILKKTEIIPKTNYQNETTYSYQFNSDGNIIERIINPNSNGLYEAKDSLIYKPSESKVERIYFESHGQISSIYTYFYNPLGKIVKEYKMDKFGSIVNKYIYEYVYW